jgi:hypothetical protein
MGAIWARARRLGGYGIKGGGPLATRLYGYGYMAISFIAIGYWLYGH